MTKERRLAIEMWEDIKAKLPKWWKKCDRSSISAHIVQYKNDFCVKHDLPWIANCWFCAYIRYCKDCPLRDCGDGAYRSIINNDTPLQVKIRACEYIISALKGEIK